MSDTNRKTPHSNEAENEPVRKVGQSHPAGNNVQITDNTAGIVTGIDSLPPDVIVEIMKSALATDASDLQSNGKAHAARIFKDIAALASSSKR